MPSKKNYVRLCSTETLFSNQEPRLDQENLSGVILLNSPENVEWSCKEYFRLLKLYRGRRPASAPPQDRPLCYFICADGAYDALIRYYQTHYSELYELALLPDMSEKAQKAGAVIPFPSLPLCDIIIGDMDSSERFEKYMNTCTVSNQPCKDSPQNEGSPSTMRPQLPFVSTGEWYDHVKQIPFETLITIRARALALARGSNDGEYPALESTLPYLFPITCQMSTDFAKSMLILRRLKRLYPCDFPEYYEDGIPLWRHPNNAEKPFVDSFDDADNDHEVEAHEKHDATGRIPLLLQKIIQRYGAALQSVIDSHEALAKAVPHHDEQKGKPNANSESTSDGESTRFENRRCVNLLKEVQQHSMIGRREGSSADDSLFLHTYILPNVAILGSLGGRFDQEIASVCTLFNFENEFHIILTNSSNVMFPCAFNGITLWLHPSSDRGKSGGVGGSAPQAVPGDVLDSTSEAAAPGKDRVPRLDHEGDICGIIPFGHVMEMETTGFLYNVVKGRSGPPLNRYDGVTQTEQFAFSFSGIVSTSNTALEGLLLVDLRILSPTHDDKHPLYQNPPTLLAVAREAYD